VRSQCQRTLLEAVIETQAEEPAPAENAPTEEMQAAASEKGESGENGETGEADPPAAEPSGAENTDLESAT